METPIGDSKDKEGRRLEGKERKRERKMRRRGGRRHRRRELTVIIDGHCFGLRRRHK